MDRLIEGLCSRLGIAPGPYRALLRTGYHTNYFIVIVGALLNPAYELRYGAALLPRSRAAIPLLSIHFGNSLLLW